ncbi:TetR/AcrR family transcriptional regulator [Clostridium swellfunianum]|uniref:TetR/AcrR family transcriptional regulator n=1 Tax=Clostridium swellfunianum TaxID=1367462 RepID=UPI00202F468F|nr:TetR/AcrR family transcriptional regulator [Clostridium swellfunianum]MCM0648056.1 TetR/AcrR family transcriptional regulator [Clostridium swellfunianum]
MANENLDTKNKLLQAAIDIFGFKGEVTTREITEAAGVNVAAINYYFGNKNNLLKEVENYYANLLNSKQHEILKNSDLSPLEKLVKWAYNLTEFMFKFPAVTELVISLATVDRTYNPALIQRVYLDKEVQDMIEDSIIKVTGCSNPQIVKHKYLEIFSGIVGLVVHHIISKIYFSEKGISGIDSDKELKEYIERFITDILSSK